MSGTVSFGSSEAAVASAAAGGGEEGGVGADRICQYFARGNCFYGDRCAYLHSMATLPAPSRRTAATPGGGVVAPYSSSSSVSTARESHPPLPPTPHPPLPVVDLGEEMSFHFQALSTKDASTTKRTPPLFTKIDSSWVDVPEFIPRFSTTDVGAKGPGSAPAAKSWAEIVNPGAMAEVTVSDAESQLCPFGAMGECRYGAHCAYIHGDICDMCGKATLHPTHEQQRRNHHNICIKQHEEQMELSFAVARSREKTCGICMEVVFDKPKGEARFGILPNCNHCYCLSCLRKWRQAKFEHKIIRSCPECRQTSDYICPSRFWVDTKEEKEKLLSEYKVALTRKECKYYRRGDGECPFGNKCFYGHFTPEGKEIDVGPPQSRPRRANADGELTLVQRLLFYDFLEEREDGRLVIPLEYLDILEMLSDSDSEHEVIL